MITAQFGLPGDGRFYWRTTPIPCSWDPLVTDSGACRIELEAQWFRKAKEHDLLLNEPLNWLIDGHETGQGHGLGQNAAEREHAGWPSRWTVLTDELKCYECELTGAGHLTYSAPSGFHDDCVIALALANSLRFTGAAGSGYMAALEAPQLGEALDAA